MNIQVNTVLILQRVVTFFIGIDMNLPSNSAVERTEESTDRTGAYRNQQAADVSIPNDESDAKDGYRLVKVKSELIMFLEQLRYMHDFIENYHNQAKEIFDYDIFSTVEIGRIQGECVDAADAISNIAGEEIFHQYFWNYQKKFDALHRGGKYEK